jgi:glyoxylase-like metal-dependent hydrolase (beta-lactamase superfamily II)
MLIRMLTTGPLETNAYLLTDSESDDALLVDCPEGSFEKVTALLEGSSVRVRTILLTHGHWDHTYDLAAFQRAGARVHAHRLDQGFIEHPEIMTSAMPGDFKVEPATIDVPVEDGTQLEWWGQKVEVRHVPGHCPGNVLFYFPAVESAFVGDAIFAGSIGRYDFPGCSFEELERSIKTRIYTLPDSTVLYPGHGPRTRVEVEKKQNPYVRG